MDNNDKLNLEWIPNAYSAKENILPKEKVVPSQKRNRLIVQSDGLYPIKKETLLGCHPER